VRGARGVEITAPLALDDVPALAARPDVRSALPLLL
jgi:hypothetical protein